jgi:hypothetical protein
MVRQVPLQWQGAIPRLRPVDCSATPLYSMKWRPHADHGQKHETGALSLTTKGPLQKQRNRKFDSSCLGPPTTEFDPKQPFLPVSQSAILALPVVRVDALSNNGARIDIPR